MTTNSAPKKTHPKPRPSKSKERSADALRQNLLRRKAQQRVRDARGPMSETADADKPKTEP